MIHVWGWDPGLVTGWCHLSVHDDGEIGVFDCGEADHNQVGNMLYDNLALKAAVSNPAIDTIFVVEKFTMAPTKTQAPWSLETIGLIRYFAAYYKIPMIMIAPSSHKPLIKNDVIKRAGLWKSSSGGHQMDAVRLCLYYLTTEKRLLLECLKS